jgi:peptidoglycan-N-acetylglucosamine deacetylase
VSSAPQGALSLTFDDGPSRNTPQVLDLLRGRGAGATFFVEGQAVGGRERLLRRAVGEGHELGNHLWSHTAPGRLSDAELRDELQMTLAAVLGAAGVAPRLVRPPYGEDAARVARVAENLGMGPVVLWSLDTLDWGRDADPREVARRATSAAQPGGVILLHDGGRRPCAAAAALPTILDELATRRLASATVSELLAARPPAPPWLVG